MTIVYDIEPFNTVESRSKFLLAVFGSDWEEKAFLVNEPNWGKRLRLEQLDDTKGCYWCVGAIPWGEPRSIATCENVRALVLDDVGTKIDTGSAMALAIGMPTAIIGTSEKNFQYVYNFVNPPSAMAFNKFRRGLLEGLQGASDGKDAVHFFRLPWGVNRKPGRGNFAVNGRLGRVPADQVGAIVRGGLGELTGSVRP